MEPQLPSRDSDLSKRNVEIAKVNDNSPERQAGSLSETQQSTATHNAEEADGPVAGKRATTPPNLSYNQRKRWRRKQRRAGLKAHNPGSTVMPRAVDQTPIQPKQRSREQRLPVKDDPRNAVCDRALLEKVTRTFLVPKPTKRWISHQEARPGLSSSSAAPESVSLPGISFSVRPSLPSDHATRSLAAHSGSRQSRSRERPADLLPEVESPVQPLIDMPDSHSDDVQPWKPTTHLLPLRRPGLPGAEKKAGQTGSEMQASDSPRSSSKLSETSPILPRPTKISQIPMDYNNYGSRVKPISSPKATSVPSYSGRKDVESAFERFNTWANGAAGTSDEESSSSNSDDDGETSGLTGLARSTVSPAADEPSTVLAISDSADSMNNASLDLNTHLTLPPKAVVPVITQVSEQAESTVLSGNADLVGASNTAPASPRDVHIAESSCGEQYSKVSSNESSSPPSDEEHPLDPTPPTDEHAVVITGAFRTDTPPTSERPALIEDASNLPLFADWVHDKGSRSTEKPQLLEMHWQQAKGDGTAPRGNDDLPAFPSSLFNHADEPDGDQIDIYKEIDDVARGVFGATRAFPFGKPHIFQDPATAEHITDDRSDVAMMGKNNKAADLPLSVQRTRSSTPENPPFGDLALGSPSPYSKCVLGIRNRSPIVFICNSVRVDDVDVPPMHLSSQGYNDTTLLQRAHNEDVHPDRESSSSELSELSESPTPPHDAFGVPLRQIPKADGRDTLAPARDADSEAPTPSPAKKRKMTGITSRHFSRSPSKQAQTPVPKRRELPDRTAKTNLRHPDGYSSPSIYATPDNAVTYSSKLTRASRKSTAKSSAFFTPAESPLSNSDSEAATPAPRKRRVPAGTSTAPVPSIKESRFGLIQEKLWDQPFWLIIAVTFLNKTAGKAAAPIFWRLKELYTTPEDLAQANEEELVDMIYHLGLQTQRAKRLIKIAKAWSAEPPVKGRRYRTLHYPAKGDGKELKRDEIVEEDSQDCAGALEIGHIPGCGPYAWDSWRIFCRDPLRGVPEDYNGTHHITPQQGEDFVPEWQRVLPLDKELRACLRWMWLREGWIWDSETGEKRAATSGEMEQAEKGEMRIEDAQERKFAEQAAGAEVVDGEEDPMIEAAEVSGDEIEVKTRRRTKGKKRGKDTDENDGDE